MRFIFALLFSSCLLLLSTTEVTAACRTRLPPAAQRVGYWSYRMFHGQRCWAGGLKASRHGHRRSMRVAKRSIHAHTDQDDRAPDEIWPRLAEPIEPQVDTFEERWSAQNARK